MLDFRRLFAVRASPDAAAVGFSGGVLRWASRLVGRWLAVAQGWLSRVGGWLRLAPLALPVIRPWLLGLMWLAVALAMLSGEFGRHGYFLDQLVHFRTHFGLFSLALVAVAAVWRAWGWSSAFLGLVFVAVWSTFPGLPTAPPLPTVPPPLTVPPAAQPGSPRPIPTVVKMLSLNVWTPNQKIAEIEALIRREAPQVVLLFETSSRLDPLLASLATDYPHQSTQAYAAGGSAILSQFPLERPSLPFGGMGAHRVALRLPEGRSVELVGVHLYSPINPEQWRWRNDGLRALAKAVKSADPATPIILAGDFNTTPYSVFFRDFLAETGLRPPATDLLPRATWVFNWAGFGIPIDHILGTPQVNFHRYRTGPGVGSDHFPVLAEWTLSDDFEGKF